MKILKYIKTFNEKSLFKNFFASDTGKYKIRLTQNFIDHEKVESIKKSMEDKSFAFLKFRISYEKVDNDETYYITEGHHRIVAALEYFKETNDYYYVEKLIKYGLSYKVKKAPKSFTCKF